MAIDRPSVPALAAQMTQREPAPFKVPWANRYTPEIAQRICEEVAEGRSLLRITIEETWAPIYWRAYQWMQDNPEFALAYDFARKAHAEAAAVKTVELADASTDHEKTKLQISTRQYLASKWNPSRYGDRRIVENNTKVDACVATTKMIDVSHLSLEEIKQAEALLMRTIEGSAVLDDEEDEE